MSEKPDPILPGETLTVIIRDDGPMIHTMTDAERRAIIYQKDYYCGICAEWFDCPARNDHCPNCGEEHAEETCPHCGYDGEMELVCPKCGIDGGNGGLSHSCCCEREIEVQHFDGV